MGDAVSNLRALRPIAGGADDLPTALPKDMLRAEWDRADELHKQRIQWIADTGIHLHKMAQMDGVTALFGPPRDAQPDQTPTDVSPADAVAPSSDASGPSSPPSDR